MKIKDAVKIAEDSGLDVQLTIEEGQLTLLATEPGPRRDANDYFVRAIATVWDDGSIAGADMFTERCRTFKKAA